MRTIKPSLMVAIILQSPEVDIESEPVMDESAEIGSIARSSSGRLAELLGADHAHCAIIPPPGSCAVSDGFPRHCIAISKGWPIRASRASPACWLAQDASIRSAKKAQNMQNLCMLIFQPTFDAYYQWVVPGRVRIIVAIADPAAQASAPAATIPQWISTTMTAMTAAVATAKHSPARQ